MPLAQKIWFIRAHKFNVFVDAELITCSEVEIVQETDAWLVRISRGLRADQPMLLESYMDEIHSVDVEVFSNISDTSDVRGHRCRLSRAKAVKHVVNPSAAKDEVLVETLTWHASKDLGNWSQIG